MAAFYNGFQGDEKSLKLIIDNIDKKSILLDGISCLGVVDITDAGDKAYYFRRSSGQVTDGKAGRLVNWNNSGVIRESIELDESFQVADFIPMYKTTNTVDIVNDRQAFNAKLIANKHNKKAIEFLIDNATNANTVASLPADGDSALATITNAIEDFKKRNKVSAMEPTAVYVSNDMAKLLFTSETFAHYSMNIPSEYRDLNGIIAKIDSALIFEAPDVDREFYYIVMNYNGFVAPLNLTSWAIKDGVAMGYPTARIIAGETRYNFQITDQDLILVGKVSIAPTPPVTQLDPVSDLAFDNNGYITWTNPATVGRIELEVNYPESGATYIDATQDNTTYIWDNTDIATWYENANIDDELAIKVTNLTTDSSTYSNSEDRWIRVKKGQSQPQYTNVAFDQSTHTASWTQPADPYINDQANDPGYCAYFYEYDTNNQNTGWAARTNGWFSDTSWDITNAVDWESGATPWNSGDTYSFEIGLNTCYQYTTIDDVRVYTRHDHTATTINGTIS